MLLVLLLAVLLGPLAARADAQTQIKVHCEIYATNHLDPIAFSSHLHNQIGNTSTTNDSTASSYFNNPSTSCDRSWFTSAGWFPVERYEPVSGVNVYYRAPGDQTKINAIPMRLQHLASQERYNCNPPAPFRDTPLQMHGHLDDLDQLPRLHQHEQAQRRGDERGLQPRRRLPEHTPLSDPAHQLPHQPP